MMAANTVPKSIFRDALKNSVLNVEIQLPEMPRFTAIRIFIGIKLLKLAAMVMGCGIEVKE